MSELRLGYSDNDGTFEATVGDDLIVALPENATTGYQWDFSSLTSDTLEHGDTERVGPSSTGAFGSGGSEVVFRFKVTAPGRGQVALTLQRGFESEDSEFLFRISLNIAT